MTTFPMYDYRRQAKGGQVDHHGRRDRWRLEPNTYIDEVIVEHEDKVLDHRFLRDLGQEDKIIDCGATLSAFHGPCLEPHTGARAAFGAGERVARAADHRVSATQGFGFGRRHDGNVARISSRRKSWESRVKEAL